MGCDIHVLIEFQRSSHYVGSFGGVFNPGRDYWLFSHLAGVRGDVDPLVQPRGPRGWGVGIPSSAVVSDAFLASGGYVYIPSVYANRDQETDRNLVDPAKADRWVADGISTRWGKFISGPDTHTPSWVTADELEEVYHRAMQVPDYPNYRIAGEYLAILAAMRSLEGTYGKESVWLQFWFDN